MKDIGPPPDNCGNIRIVRSLIQGRNENHCGLIHMQHVTECLTRILLWIGISKNNFRHKWPDNFIWMNFFYTIWCCIISITLPYSLVLTNCKKVNNKSACVGFRSRFERSLRDFEGTVVSFIPIFSQGYSTIISEFKHAKKS